MNDNLPELSETQFRELVRQINTPPEDSDGQRED